MGNICCLLDACTVINFIHIDEDDFLLKKMEKLDIHINDTVFGEINANVYKGQNTIRNQEDAEKNIEQKLTFFRGRNSDNGKLLKDAGSDYLDTIKTLTGYTKKTNGELYSTAYALYLSRIDEKKVFFYTDDYPAKEYFSPFFDYHQIGHIKDSVDLLILLYWIDDKFTESQLDNTLSSLHAQYATEVTLLKQKLRDFQTSKIDLAFRKAKKEIVEKLNTLINHLDKLDFKNIGTLYSFFESNKLKCKDIYEILKNHPSVFELEKNANAETLLGKISRTRKAIKQDKILKWNDLLAQ
jgi:hypothetical protein